MAKIDSKKSKVDAALGNSEYKYDMIRAMPRRESSESTGSGQFSIALPPKNGTNPIKLLVLIRLIAWVLGLVWYVTATLLSRIFHRSSLQNEGKRLRKILERMGPAAIKVGQQLSVRADVLPYEYCTELSKMLDKMPPFPVEHAITTIEQTTGKNLNELFSEFDPVPIGSASLSCVYQAKLPDGKLVAVKVKRPGITQKLNADLQAINVLCLLAEKIGWIRTGLTRNFREELARMFSEELNFYLEARYTEIFGQQCKKNKNISAPRVFQELCGEEVIVTEFVSGVYMIEILNVIEQDDEDAKAKLEARGFDFKKIARRLMHIFHWECFETYFFHADPHPANLIVRPDNTIVMIDFGSCGSVSKKVQRRLLLFNRQMVMEDFHAMAQTTVAMLEPLPPIDTDRYTNDLIDLYRQVFIANKSSNATWYEKCSGGMWMKVIALCRDYNIPMTLDSVRLFRATFMYDSIILRLWADLDPREEFKKWARKYNKKKKQFVKKEAQKRLCGLADDDYTRGIELALLTDQVFQRLQHFLDTPKHNFGYSVGKVAFAFSTMLRSSVSLMQFFILLVIGKLAKLVFIDKKVIEEINVLQELIRVAGHPAFLFFALVYILVVMRKIILRISDLDVDTS